MKFRYRKSFPKGYNEQGYIFFTCQNYQNIPKALQNKIIALCAECGMNVADALFEVLTTTQPITAIALKYYVDASSLWRKTKNFYGKW